MERMKKLIIGKMPYSEYRKLPKERRNLLKKRFIEPDALREGRKIFASLFKRDEDNNLTFDTEKIEEMRQKDPSLLNLFVEACNACDCRYAINEINRVGETSRRGRLFKTGLVLCMGEYYLKNMYNEIE